jgi:hypothetical protein
MAQVALIVDASVAIVANTAAVPPNAERDEVRAVGVAKHRAQQPREHETHEECEGEQHGHADGAVLRLVDREHEAECDREEEHHADDRIAGEEAEAVATPIHAPGDRRQHRNGEQEVGVAQDPVLGERDRCRAWLRHHRGFGLHAFS